MNFPIITKVEFKFICYNLRIGLFIDVPKSKFYFIPFPMFVYIIHYK